MSKYAISRQDFYDGDKVVTLTASVKSGSVTKKKDFKFIVKKSLMTDEQSVAEDKKYIQANMPLTITSNVDLMKTNPLPFGSTVTWKSTNTTYLSNNGTVNRPDFGSPSEKSTVTASLSKGDASDTLELAVTIASMSTEDELSVAARKITWDLIKKDNIDKSRIISDLNLVSTMDTIPVVWQSTEPTVIATNGTVTRPDYEAMDMHVTLTATLTKEGKSQTVTMDGLKVLKNAPSPQQRCELYVNDSENILKYITANGTNSNTGFKEIRESFVLPAEQDDMLMVWKLVKQNGEAASPNSYITVTYQDGVAAYSVDRKYLASVTRPTGSNVTTYLEITATINSTDDDLRVAAGEAKKIYEICILDSQAETYVNRDVDTNALPGMKGKATWSQNHHIQEANNDEI